MEDEDEQEYSYEEADTADYADEQEYYSETSPLPRGTGGPDDDDDDDGADATSPSLTRGLKAMKVPDGGYIITSFAEIVPYRDALVAEVSALLDLDADCAVVLLQHFGWAKEKLLDAMFGGRQAEIMAECGLDLYDAEVGRSLRGLLLWEEGKEGEGKEEGKGESKWEEGKEAAPPSAPAQLSSQTSSPAAAAVAAAAAGGFSPMKHAECRICYDASDLSGTAALGCGHAFHPACYRGYLESELGAGPACTLGASWSWRGGEGRGGGRVVGLCPCSRVFISLTSPLSSPLFPFFPLSCLSCLSCLPLPPQPTAPRSTAASAFPSHSGAPCSHPPPSPSSISTYLGASLKTARRSATALLPAVTGSRRGRGCPLSSAAAAPASASAAARRATSS